MPADARSTRPDPEAPTVEVSQADAVRFVTLRRPPSNALSAVEYAALRAAFRSPTLARVTVLRGSGRAFCSGQDVAEAAGLSGQLVAPYLADAGAAIAAVAATPIPLVTVVNGPAVGAGALLACLGDVVIISETAWWSVPEAHHGLPLGLSLLSRALPVRVARELLATARRIPASQLAAVGAVDRVVTEDQLDAAAEQAVRELLELPADLATWLFPPADRETRARDYLTEVDRTIAAGSWQF
jgi:2-(1,2-epoxy-1,2-dihydrophenyl)acetyl-CoA isomerase